MYLHTRLLLGITWVTALALCASAVLPFISVDSDVTRETDAALQLATVLQGIEAGARSAGSGREALAVAADQVRRAGHLRHVRLVLTSAAGTTVTQSPADEHEGGWLARELPPIERKVVAYPVMFHGTAVGELHLYSNPFSEIAELEERVQSDVVLMATAVLVVALIMYWTVRRGLKPVALINSALTRLAGGNLDTRLPHFRLRDLDEISDRFNHCAAALQEAAGQRRQLTRRLMQVQEEERTRLARELHDELGQVLTAVKVDAAYIVRESRGRLPKVESCARDVEQLTTELMDLVRGILVRLRPHGLETLGLSAALEELVNGWRARIADRFSCSVVTEGPIDSLGPELNITLYRLVQECLTNAVRHSSARSIAIRLSVESSPEDGMRRVWVRVGESDGAAADERSGADGTGLLGMRERVEALGGEFRVSAQGGVGRLLEAWMPVPAMPEETLQEEALPGEDMPEEVHSA